MATTTEVRAEVAAQRRELASLLAALSPERWDEPSLCEGWRVRDVVAHIVMPYRYSLPRVILEILKSRGSFNRMADRRARRDADDLSTAELVAVLEKNVNHPWKPPGSGFEGALSHDVIHGLDITVALGLEHRVPPERVGIVLGSVRPKQLKYFGVDLDGVQLIADDLDWRYGDSDGRPVRGHAQDLLLVICGRTVPSGRLSGEDSARFSTA